jgi:FixJ family two-component response regulator
VERLIDAAPGRLFTCRRASIIAALRPAAEITGDHLEVVAAREYLQSPRLSDTSCLVPDVEMPGMTGIKLQEHLISHGHTTPIIFITAFPEDHIRDQCDEGGAIGFLTKPFDESRLLECIQQALISRRDDPDRT